MGSRAGQARARVELAGTAGPAGRGRRRGGVRHWQVVNPRANVCSTRRAGRAVAAESFQELKAVASDVYVASANQLTGMAAAVESTVLGDTSVIVGNVSSTTAFTISALAALAARRLV